MSGIVLCSFSGCLLSKWADYQVVWVVSLCLISLLISTVSITGETFFIDSVSGPILSMSIVVTAMSILGISTVSHTWEWKKSSLLFMSLGIVEVFLLSKSLILMFVSFELSLVPMLALILLWSSSPERVMASKFMVLYTMVASAPLLYVIIILSSTGQSLDLVNHLPSFSADNLVIFFCLFAFLVKAPMYLTHSWLPRAHVEAPLEGSMVLAGIMLKVGVYGLIRMMSILQLQNTNGVLLLVYSISLMGSVYSMSSALTSDDLKMSVAFSSVSHMNLCVAGLCTHTSGGLVGGVISMVSHGLVSPLLFFNVTLLYLLSHTRSVLLNKGAHGKFPQMKMLSLLVWVMNLGVPPFLSFIGELSIFGSILFFSSSGLIVLLFMIAGSVFMALNYGILNHSGLKLLSKGVVPLMGFLLAAMVVSFVSVLAFFLS